jgi:hypothetical protein
MAMNNVKFNMIVEMYKGHMKHVDRELERLIAYMAVLLDVQVSEVLAVLQEYEGK